MQPDSWRYRPISGSRMRRYDLNAQMSEVGGWFWSEDLKNVSLRSEVTGHIQKLHGIWVRLSLEGTFFGEFKKPKGKQKPFRRFPHGCRSFVHRRPTKTGCLYSSFKPGHPLKVRVFLIFWGFVSCTVGGRNPFAPR